MYDVFIFDWLAGTHALEFSGFDRIYNYMHGLTEM